MAGGRCVAVVVVVVVVAVVSALITRTVEVVVIVVAAVVVLVVVVAANLYSGVDRQRLFFGSLLLFHSSILKPNLDLRFVQLQTGRDFDASSSSEVPVKMKFLLELGQLFGGEVGAARVVVYVVQAELLLLSRCQVLPVNRTLSAAPHAVGSSGRPVTGSSVGRVIADDIVYHWQARVSVSGETRRTTGC